MPAIGPGLLNSLLIPNVGDGVWVEFVVGDIERPQGTIADIKKHPGKGAVMGAIGVTSIVIEEGVSSD